MHRYKYLIVGGGMTGDSAAKGIREVDAEGSIGMICGEAQPPYKRPPLTKGLWKGKPEDSIWLKTDETGVSMHLGSCVTQLDPERKLAIDDHGEEYAYEKLLLATGGTPRQLLFTHEHMIYYRYFDDYRHLRELTERGDRFAVIGGGFIGSEIAAALTMNGKHVSMVFPDNGISERVFPSELSEFLVSYYRQQGTEVFAADAAMELEEWKGRYLLRTGSGQELMVDAVVAGVGIDPNTKLAESAGVMLQNGITVSPYCQTSHSDIYSAGDCASFINPTLGKRMRVEHEDNAITMGKYAGRSMAGHEEPYNYLPFFYSDLFDLGYEAVGDTDPKLETFSDWKEPFKEGVIYYLSEGRVRGAVLWNVWDKVPVARELIAENGPFTAEDLKGRITN